MLKKLILSALIALPFAAFAQDKVAYVNSDTLMALMPESKLLQDSIQKTQEAQKAYMSRLEDEYQSKYEAFMREGDKLLETIKIRRMNELQNLEKDAANYQQEAQQELQRLYESLLIPIQQKVQKAIQDVGAENNFAYILDKRVFLFINPNATDATPLVKQKLGL
ncbi:MAG: OmpH family outer membrane protein [Candidatus Symbiothrix sp.]|jgi:outer membrane protein|nr:OmpH family outer membrane protein [Candidatus Symbiothrix sp.]